MEMTLGNCLEHSQNYNENYLLLLQDLNIEFQIRFHSDLKQAIAVTRDYLADGTISDVTTGGDCKPFDKLVPSGQWDDVLLYHFKCNTCGQLFELSTETYHGRGDWWKPLDNRQV